MLHLKSRVEKGSNTATFQYIPPSPFAKNVTLRLVDLIARPAGPQADLLAISLELMGTITSKRTLRDTLKEPNRPTVERIVTRLKAHNQILEKAFSILAEQPLFGYDEKESRFYFHLPPNCGVFEGRALPFGLLGFDTSKLRQFPHLKAYGFFNTEETSVKIAADERVGLGLDLRDAFDMLETTNAFTPADLTSLGPGQMSFVFMFRPPPDGRKFAVQKKIRSLTSAEEAVEIIQPSLSELEAKLRLKAGTLLIEKKGSGLMFSAASPNVYDLKLVMNFNQTLAKLINAAEEMIIDLNPLPGTTDPTEGGKRGKIMVGPIEPLHSNKLTSYLPLILKVLNFGGTSYMTGHGMLSSLGFIDEDGEIYPISIDTKDLPQSTMECQFFQRDLTQLQFDEDLELFAHFIIVPIAEK